MQRGEVAPRRLPNIMTHDPAKFRRLLHAIEDGVLSQDIEARFGIGQPALVKLRRAMERPSPCARPRNGRKTKA